MTTGLIELDESRRADAGTAINEAIAALPSYGGKILIGGGDWTLDTSVLIDRDAVILEGLGRSTSLWFSGTGAGIKKDLNTTRLYDVKILDMGIYTTTHGQGTGIDGTKFSRSVFRGLYIGKTGNAPSRGMSFNSDMTYYNSIENSAILVYLSGGISRCLEFQSNANSNQVNNLRISGDDNTTGVYVNAHSNQLIRVDGEASMNVGILVGSSGHGCDIISPYFESINQGIYMASGVQHVNIFGGTLENNTYNIRDMGAVSRTTTGTWFS